MSTPTHAPTAVPTAAAQPSEKRGVIGLISRFRKTIVALVGVATLGGGYYGWKGKDVIEGNAFRDMTQSALTHIKELEDQGLKDDIRIKHIKAALETFKTLDNGQVDDLGTMEKTIGTLNTSLESITMNINSGATRSDITKDLDTASVVTKNIEKKTLQEVAKGLQTAIKNLQSDMQNQPQKYSWVNGNYFTDSWGENVADSFGIDSSEIKSSTMSMALKELSDNPDILSQALADPTISNLFLKALKVNNGYSVLLDKPIPDSQSLTIELTTLLEGSGSSNVTAGVEKIPGLTLNLIGLLYILGASFGGVARHIQARKEADPTRKAELKKKRNDWMKYWLLSRHIWPFSKKIIAGGASKLAGWTATGGRHIHGKMTAKAQEKISEPKNAVDAKKKSLLSDITTGVTETDSWIKYLTDVQAVEIPALKGKLTTAESDILTLSVDISTLQSSIARDRKMIKDKTDEVLADPSKGAAYNPAIAAKQKSLEADEQILASKITEKDQKEKETIELKKKIQARTEATKRGGETHTLITELKAYKKSLKDQSTAVTAINLSTTIKVSHLTAQEKALEKVNHDVQTIIAKLDECTTRCDELAKKINL